MLKHYHNFKSYILSLNLAKFRNKNLILFLEIVELCDKLSNSLLKILRKYTLLLHYTISIPKIMRIALYYIDIVATSI